jgi:hypothetical protein
VAGSESYSTTRDALDVDRSRLTRGLIWRRIFVVVLCLFVLAAVTGWLGVRTRTVRASRDGLSAELHYASIARRGISTPWELQIDRAGGFDDDVSVVVSLSYFDALDVQQITPQPSDSTTTSETVRWTFTKPSSDAFSVVLGTSVNPSVLPGRHRGTATVTTGDGEQVRLHFTTWVMP